MIKSITSKVTLVKILVLVGFIILIASGVAWWRMIYSSPTNVFDRMLENTLSSNSVSKVIIQADQSQNLNQTTNLVARPKQIVQSLSILGQSSNDDTVITTESIGTPNADYVRYTDIKTSQKSATGKTFDFSTVLGLWGKADNDDPSTGGAQLFNQTVLGVVPVANVSQPMRSELLKQIKNDEVYTIDAGSVKRQIVNGRPVYTYDVTVQPVQYVTMLKNFARSVGIVQLEQVDPSQYKNSAPLKFTFDIDVWSGQLQKISYSDSTRIEVYSAYGAKTQISEPESSIGVQELQTKLQQIQ